MVPSAGATSRCASASGASSAMSSARRPSIISAPVSTSISVHGRISNAMAQRVAPSASSASFRRRLRCLSARSYRVRACSYPGCHCVATRSMSARRTAGAPTTRPVSSGTNTATLIRSMRVAGRRGVPLRSVCVRPCAGISTASVDCASGSVASSSPTVTVRRAASAPRATTSRSADARWERPVAAMMQASRSVVFPAPFTPQSSCGPLPSTTVPCVQLRMLWS